MKKIFAVLLAAVMVISLAACSQGGTEEAQTSGRDELMGGWTVYKDIPTVALPEDLQKAFDSVFAGARGAEYTAAAYLGSQVVSGTNHAVLCKSTANTESATDYLSVAVIYIDLDGNAELINNTDFIIAQYTEGEGTAPEQLDGGWSVPEEVQKSELPGDAEKLYDKAFESYDGSKPEPVTLLGTQVVAGTNYAYLCYSADGDIPCYQVVTVYADLDDNAEVTNIYTLDISAFNE